MFLTVVFFALVLLGLTVLTIYMMAKSRAKKMGRRHSSETKQATKW